MLLLSLVLSVLIYLVGIGIFVKITGDELDVSVLVFGIMLTIIINLAMQMSMGLI